MTDKQLIRDAAEVWAPNYPRRVAEPLPSRWRQVRVQSVDEVAYHVNEAGHQRKPGFVSTYSFPDGHTSDEGDNIPRIDTLFFDMDREGSRDDGSKAGWARDMSALLARSRMVAQKLLDSGKYKYWRASLSGHKGVHFYLDFEPIPVENGSVAQFEAGMKEYTNKLVDWLEDATSTNLADYMDVSSGHDLARLTRLPNSLHEEATQRFGETRYCVPVSIKELAKVTPKKYIALTQQPREMPPESERVPNEKAHDVISRMVRNASGSSHSGSGWSGSGYDVGDVLSEYGEKRANTDVSLQLAKLHLKQKPCIWAFRENPDAFTQGHESHVMEMNVISALKNLDAPVDVMHEFFQEIDGYDETLTDERIAAVVGADMAKSDDDEERYRGLNCSTIIESAPSFCLGEQDGLNNCRIWDHEFAGSPIPER